MGIQQIRVAGWIRVVLLWLLIYMGSKTQSMGEMGKDFCPNRFISNRFLKTLTEGAVTTTYYRRNSNQ